MFAAAEEVEKVARIRNDTFYGLTLVGEADT